MARLGRKPVRPGRATIAVSLGSIGLFVISMAAGMRNWPFGAAGAAMLVVAVALLTTASMRGSEKAYVVGTVHVVKVSEPPLTTDYGRCEMQVLVDAPGHPGQTVVIRDPRVPVTKWPDVGETLPALVSVSDARRIKIQWERVGTYGERFEADQDEENLNGTHGSAGSPGEPGEPGQPRPSYPDSPRPAPASQSAAPDGSLPRRQPAWAQPTLVEAHSVAVLEGELVPSQRTPAEEVPRLPAVDSIDFSHVPEPPAATPPQAGPAFTPAHAGPASTPPQAGPAQAGPAFTPPTFTQPAFTPPAFSAEPSSQVIITQPQARPASAGSIHGVGFTVLVTDLQRSLTFYRDMLGFYEIDGSTDTVILASGDTRVVLVTAQELSPVHKRLVHLNLEVGDVEAVYEELKIRGIKFTYPPKVVNRGERLELYAAAFKDPDGHGVAISQWKARNV